ncbi:putative alpha- sarcomeric (f-actin cross linking protein) protein [Botrytis fragariae]|uniref:Putative alpha- sarcomeric (F-actin cross linking protein) protein n=1 Tax=Botrytis fragariae TaxID=1964551 RepID=A0A8H6B5E2_9HELO|nr:putative alpha- sarcomeric (f-actin cross linking protein) protein [Botrytis fragariae]KAF5879574.1 putative alpha- sarcomeric (f-actin cross linking protein) protein [Botrytis fragariae]
MFSALKKSLRIEPKTEAPKNDTPNKEAKEEDRIEDVIVIKDLDATRKEGESEKIKEARDEDLFVVKDLDARLEEEDIKREQNLGVEEGLEDDKREPETIGEKYVKEEDALVVKDLDVKDEIESVEEKDAKVDETHVETDVTEDNVQEESTSELTLPSISSKNIEIPLSPSPPSPPSSEIGDHVEESKGKQTPTPLAASAIFDTPGNDRCLVGSPPATTANPNLEVNKFEETSTSTSPRHSRTISPTPIENHSHTQNQEKRFSSSTTDFEINAPNTPPATPPRVVRRERSASQRERETLRSRQFSEAARLQRSAEKPEKSEEELGLGRRRKRYQHRNKSKGSISGSGEALKAVEPLHEHQLGKMAFAEQQQWITVQQKTFTKWLNTKIAHRKLEVIDLVKDLSDGVILIHLLECLSNESLGRYAAKPKLRVQRFENANLSLDFIKSRGIQMTNIGAEDVVDGNRKIILGLIWTLILRFTISDINLEGMTAKEGLLLWCQRKTACYEEVDVRNFTDSWNDGLAFCALLDIHRPDLIDYDTLDKDDHRGNMQLAFDIATKEIGIPALLDVEDVCDVAKPDERSLMTYIAYWFHAFSQMEKVENAGRRVEKFVNNMQGAWEMQSAYEKRMRALLKSIKEQVLTWQDATFEGTYADAKKQATHFSSYKRGQKREWVAEKSDLAALLGNIKTKLSTYRLRAYDPPPELRLSVLDEEWAKLMKGEMARGQLINETIRDIKNALRRSFADKANDFATTLNTMQLAISGLEGDVEDQLVHVRRLHDNLPPLNQFLDQIEAIDKKCEEANIEENDFTTYTYDELCYEMSLVKNSVAKKLAFLDNQVVARNMTNLTPIQLEEFESVFRHFDRDATNSLQELEFSAALASLGLVFSEDEMHDYFLDTSNGKDYVTFEEFIRFMVDVTEDQNTAEQVFQSFREVADGKPYVTEMDLRHSLVPDEVIEKLTQFIPMHKGPDLQEDRGMPQYDYISFMDKLLGGNEEDGNEGALSELTNGRNPKRASGSGGKANGTH